MSSRVLTVEIVGNSAQLEQALGRASAATKGFGARVGEAGRAMTAVGRTLTSAVTVPVVAAGAASVKMAVDFQKSMELVHTQAGVSQKAVDSMSKSVLNMAASVGTTPETLSQGLFHLASQGLRGARALDALRIAAEGAKVGQANLEDVTNALGAVLVSGIKGAQDYSQAMGALNATVGAGDMHMQDLADAMGTGLPTKAAIFGVSLRDVGAALAVFGDNNIRGAQAGTLLNSTFRIMAAGSAAADKALKTVGLSTLQLGEDMRSKGGLVSALEDLKAHMEDAGLTAAEQAQLLTHAFGGRQSGGVMILLDQLERLKTKEREVAAGASGFGSAWASTTQTASFKFDQLKAALAATAITIGDQLLPMVLSAVKTFEGWVQAFDKVSPSTKALIEKIALIAAAIGPALLVGGKFLTFFKDLSALLPIVASPMGALAGAVMLVGGALVAAEYAPQQFESALEKLGLSAKDAKRVVDDLRMAFDAIKTVVEAVWPVIKATIVADLKIIEDAVKMFSDLLHGRWSALWGDLKNLVSTAFMNMVNVAKAELTLLLNTAGRLAQAIGEGILHHILDPIKNLAVELWNWLVREITGAVNRVVGWVKGEASSIGHAITSGILSGIGSLAGSLGGALVHGAGSALSSVGSFLGISSPSEVFRRRIGRPIGQGIVEGAKEALAGLARAISGTITSALDTGSAATVAGLRRLINAAASAVRSGTPAVQAAMRNLANGVMDAFDRQTQAGLDRIRSNLETKLNQIKQNAEADLGTINKAFQSAVAANNAPVTALQKQIQAQQRAHDTAAAQQAVDAAKAQLAADQGSGADAATLAADQQAIQEALYQQQQLLEQYQLQDAQAEAAKKNAAAKAEKDKATKLVKAGESKDTQKARDGARQESEQWRERRKEERKQLEAYIADLRTSLDKMATEWGKYGSKSGKVYADGLKKAESEISKEVEAIRRLIREGLGLDVKVTVASASGGLPSHAAGGPTKAGLAVLHDGEYVIQRSAANAIGRTRLDMLNRLPHFATGGPVGGSSDANNPTTPAERASAMWMNDYGDDKNTPKVRDALLYGTNKEKFPMALRHTYVDNVPGIGRVELEHGIFGGMSGQAIADEMRQQVPDMHGSKLTFEEWTADQIGWGSAVSRLHGGLNMAKQLILASVGRHGKDSPVEMLTSHAIHFRDGGITLADGLAMLHKNEAIIPLPKNGTGSLSGGVTLHIGELHVHGDLSDPTQRRQTARLLIDDMHSELARKSRRNSTLGLR